MSIYSKPCNGDAGTLADTARSPLLPLMHWPSFSQLLISRHDKQDIVFRCFLLSLGTSIAPGRDGLADPPFSRLFDITASQIRDTQAIYARRARGAASSMPSDVEEDADARVRSARVESYQVSTLDMTVALADCSAVLYSRSLFARQNTTNPPLAATTSTSARRARITPRTSSWPRPCDSLSRSGCTTRMWPSSRD